MEVFRCGHRRLSLIGWVLLAVAMGSCADRKSSHEPPTDVEPLSNLVITLVNETNETIVVPWAEDRPVLHLTLGSESITTERGCIEECQNGCTCGTCSIPVDTFVRIAAHSEYTFTWTALRYAKRGCGKHDTCTCVQAWPLTYGTYDVAIKGFSSPVAGQPVEGDEALVIGAKPGDSSRKCTADFSFELQKKAEIKTSFWCIAGD